MNLFPIGGGRWRRPCRLGAGGSGSRLGSARCLFCSARCRFQARVPVPVPPVPVPAQLPLDAGPARFPCTPFLNIIESPELRWHPNNASIAGLPPPPRTFRVHPWASLVQFLQRVKLRLIKTEAILELIILPIAKQIALFAYGEVQRKSGPNIHTHCLSRIYHGLYSGVETSITDESLEDKGTIALAVLCWSPARGQSEFRVPSRIQLIPNSRLSIPQILVHKEQDSYKYLWIQLHEVLATDARGG